MNLPQGKADAEAIPCLGEPAEERCWSHLDPTLEGQAQKSPVFMTAWPKGQAARQY